MVTINHKSRSYILEDNPIYEMVWHELQKISTGSPHCTWSPLHSSKTDSTHTSKVSFCLCFSEHLSTVCLQIVLWPLSLDVLQHLILYSQFRSTQWFVGSLLGAVGWCFNSGDLSWNANHCVLQNLLFLSISPPFLRGDRSGFIHQLRPVFISFFIPLAQADWLLISQSEKKC